MDTTRTRTAPPDGPHPGPAQRNASQSGGSGPRGCRERLPRNATGARAGGVERRTAARGARTGCLMATPWRAWPSAIWAIGIDGVRSSTPTATCGSTTATTRSTARSSSATPQSRPAPTAMRCIGLPGSGKRLRRVPGEPQEARRQENRRGPMSGARVELRTALLGEFHGFGGVGRCAARGRIPASVPGTYGIVT